MTSVPFSQDLAIELAQREAFLERTRSARVGAAQALIRQAMPPVVERTVAVMEPFVDMEGRRHFRKVMRTRVLPIRLTSR